MQGQEGRLRKALLHTSFPGIRPSSTSEILFLLQPQLTHHLPEEATPIDMVDILSPVPLPTPSLVPAMLAALLQTFSLS